MSDETTTVSDVRRLVAAFVDERDWRQFHSPKNLCMSLAIETAELMEHFQWIGLDESRAVAGDGEKKHAVAEELADVFCYAFALANELDIDVASAVADKMKKNALKYPAAEFRGRYGPEDQGSQS